jgi:hypothetical protein
MVRSITLLLALGFATFAHAQAIYKYVMPDGRVVYSDKPVPGARLEEELEPPPPPVAAPPRRAAPVPRSTQIDERSKALDQAWEDLKFWTRKLEEGRAALEAGREPREGERTGTVSGRARMNDVYWERQRDNVEAVREAEARAKEAQDSINRLR